MAEIDMGTAVRSIQDLMQETDWFQQLHADIKQRVLADVHERRFASGETVAHKGEPASSWIGVAEGLLKISVVSRPGKVVMFAGIPEGSWVGEGSVLKREMRRYDIIAMRPSRVLHLPRATFRWLLDTSIDFNQSIISRLNERLAQFMGMMEIDRLSDPVARVARAIGTLYNPVLYAHMGPLLPLSQTELGELIGMTRQSIGSALKQLEAEGLTSTKYGGVLVKKVAALVSYEERDPH
jgi:CRP/FNR family cyclic AMP-dependent transcriptional regulator